MVFACLITADSKPLSKEGSFGTKVNQCIFLYPQQGRLSSEISEDRVVRQAVLSWDIDQKSLCVLQPESNRRFAEEIKDRVDLREQVLVTALTKRGCKSICRSRGFISTRKLNSIQRIEFCKIA